MNKEQSQNKEQGEGNWSFLKGKVRQKWGKLTDSELDQIDGNMEQLKGKLQEKYGYTREQAERELETFEKNVH